MCISSKGIRRPCPKEIGKAADEIPVCPARIKPEAAHLFNIRRPDIKVGRAQSYYRHHWRCGCAVYSAGCSDALLISTWPTRFCDIDWTLSTYSPSITASPTRGQRPSFLTM